MSGQQQRASGESLRIKRASLSDLPSVERVVLLAERAQMIVLDFGTTFVLTEDGSQETGDVEKRRLIAALTSGLPDHTVFDSGGSHDGPMLLNYAERLRHAGQTVTGTSRISVMKVIPRAVVLENAEAIVEAARQFRSVATDLMTRLSRRLGVEPVQFAADPMFWHRFGQSGNLNEEWGYFFHGFECGFGHRRTGQDLDVRLGFMGETGTSEFGVLDPYFFAHFVRSTPGLEPVADLFTDDYHDPNRTLDVLLEAGRLRRMDRILDGQRLGWGYVAD